MDKTLVPPRRRKKFTISDIEGTREKSNITDVKNKRVFMITDVDNTLDSHARHTIPGLDRRHDVPLLQHELRQPFHEHNTIAGVGSVYSNHNVPRFQHNLRQPFHAHGTKTGVESIHNSLHSNHEMTFFQHNLQQPASDNFNITSRDFQQVDSYRDPQRLNFINHENCIWEELEKYLSK